MQAVGAIPEEFTLAFFEEIEEYFAAYAKSNDCHKEFGKRELFQLCNLGESGGKKEFYMPLLEKLLSLNISFDVKEEWEGKSPFEICKKRGKWDIYEKLNLSKMGESLKGKSFTRS